MANETRYLTTLPDLRDTPAGVINTRMMRQAIETRYVGPTNTRGSRIRAAAQAGSLSVDYDPRLGIDANHARAAEALASRYGWTGKLIGGGLADGRGNVFVFVD